MPRNLSVREKERGGIWVDQFSLVPLLLLFSESLGESGERLKKSWGRFWGILISKGIPF